MITLIILLSLLYAKQEAQNDYRDITVARPGMHIVLKDRIYKSDKPGTNSGLNNKKEELLRELRSGNYGKTTRIIIEADGYVPFRHLKIYTPDGLLVFDSVKMVPVRAGLMGNGVKYRTSGNIKQSQEASEFTLAVKSQKIDNNRHRIIVNEKDATKILMAALSKDKSFEDLEIIIVR